MPLPKRKTRVFSFAFPLPLPLPFYLISVPLLLTVLTWAAAAGPSNLRLLSQLSSSTWRLFAAASAQCPYNCHKPADDHLSSQLTEGERNAQNGMA